MSVRVKLGGSWDQWMRATRSPSKDGGALVEWADVVERMFDASQETVHVITGRLRQSGSVSITEDSHHRFVGVIEYAAPYAAAEALRGGTHDYMQRAYEATAQEFTPAVGRALSRMVERQFGHGD